MGYYNDTTNMAFSVAQSVLATTDATNVIDLGESPTLRAICPANPMGVRLVVTEAYNNLTSITVAVKSDSTTSLDTSETVMGTQTILLAGLTLGAEYFIPIDCVTQTCERYLGIEYTVTGTAPTTGKLTAVLVPASDSRQYFPDASTIL